MIFFLDTEYTNGNLYLGDIFEIACISSDDKVFHSYINISSDISCYVKRLCDVNIGTLQQSPTFENVIDRFIDFINQDKTQPILIGHGAFLSDFPLILANCMKNCYDYSKLKDCIFIDSMEAFKEKGYKRPGLTSLTSTTRTVHSALEDVKLLKGLVTDYHDIRYKLHTFKDILYHTQKRMPLTFNFLSTTAKQRSRDGFEHIILQHIDEKSALNKKQFVNIVTRYYK